jgi:transposase
MRYKLNDHEWAAIKPMLPNKPRGVPRVNDRRVLNGIFWILRSGLPAGRNSLRQARGQLPRLWLRVNESTP